MESKAKMDSASSQQLIYQRITHTHRYIYICVCMCIYIYYILYIYIDHILYIIYHILHIQIDSSEDPSLIECDAILLKAHGSCLFYCQPWAPEWPPSPTCVRPLRWFRSRRWHPVLPHFSGSPGRLMVTTQPLDCNKPSTSVPLTKK